MTTNIRASVYAVAIILIIIPSVSSFWATQSIVESAVGMGLSSNVALELDRAGHCLKEAAKLNPYEMPKYRDEFNLLQKTRSAYTILLDSSSLLNRAYIQVFAIILAGALAVGLVLATWLNRKVIRSHDTAIREMKEAQARTLYLENRES
jgi:hypothetical protein